MAHSELCFYTAAALAPLLRQRKVSPVEVVEALLAHIEALNSMLRAYLYINGEQGLVAAQAAESELRAGGYRGLNLPSVAPETTAVDAQWVLDFARLTGLTFVTAADAKSIAASIGPVKAQLAAARQRLGANIEPPVRPAPA